MSGPIGSSQLMYSSAADNFYDHQIASSLRNSTGQDGTLKRTAGTPTSADTFTMSYWVKRYDNSTGGEDNNIFVTGTGGGTYIIIGFKNNNFQAEFTGGTYGDTRLITNALYRDTSAWYHHVLRFDSTQSTATNRVRLYVNGTEVSYNSQTVTGAVDQNEDFDFINENGVVQAFGGLSGKGHGTEGADLQMAEIVFNDGQSYAPSNYGETKNGVWIPKDPSGLTFGNNGYYLKMLAGAIGTDSSGNGNDFTVANFAAHDVLLDSPTNKFCTWNAIDYTGFNNQVLGEGNLALTIASNTYAKSITTMGAKTGKWYWETDIQTMAAGGAADFVFIGVSEKPAESSNEFLGKSANSAGWYVNNSGSPASYLLSANGNAGAIGDADDGYAEGNIIACALDLDSSTKTIEFYKNGTKIGNTINLPAAMQDIHLLPAASDYANGGGTSLLNLNCGQDGTFNGQQTAQGNADGNGFGDFYYSPPSGFLAICSANLPIAAGVDPAQTDDDYSQKAFDVVTYVGNGQARTISTNFKADNIWVKDMDSSRRHYLVTNTINANFGTTSYLHPSNAVSEGNSTDGITASAASTFTIGGSLDYVNNNTNNYVSYLWRVNGGTTSALNDGDINATGQINQTHGCGVLLYTGDGGSSNVTMAHGMGSKPEFMWLKDRDSNGNNNQWGAWHTKMQDDYYMYLSLDSAEAASGNGSIDTSNVTDTLLAWLRTSTTGGSQTRFENGDNFIIYQFVGVEGHSKFGSYEGNGNADGAFVYTGFSPAFVMVKSLDSTSDWEMYDYKRAGYNVDNNQLEANDEAAQDTGTFIDLLSNGFKMRASGDPNVAETYIYAAWAHNSFKYANAR